MDHIRRLKVSPLEFTSDPAVLNQIDERAGLEERLSAQQETDIILAVIRAFPRRQREVFWLYRVEGYSLEEIAMQLGISEATARKHMALAVIRLKHALNALGVTK